MATAQLRALLAAATPGPWTTTAPDGAEFKTFMAYGSNGLEVAELGFAEKPAENTALIVALRNNAERLLAVVEAAEDAVDCVDEEDKRDALRNALAALKGDGTK
jgi:hypothetical protein